MLRHTCGIEQPLDVGTVDAHRTLERLGGSPVVARFPQDARQVDPRLDEPLVYPERVPVGANGVFPLFQVDETPPHLEGNLRVLRAYVTGLSVMLQCTFKIPRLGERVAEELVRQRRRQLPRAER